MATSTNRNLLRKPTSMAVFGALNSRVQEGEIYGRALQVVMLIHPNK